MTIVIISKDESVQNQIKNLKNDFKHKVYLFLNLNELFHSSIRIMNLLLIDKMEADNMDMILLMTLKRIMPNMRVISFQGNQQALKEKDVHKQIIDFYESKESLNQFIQKIDKV